MRFHIPVYFFVKIVQEGACLMEIREINDFSIYTLSDLGVLSNLIGLLSLANEHYSPPTE